MLDLTSRGGDTDEGARRGNDDAGAMFGAKECDRGGDACGGDAIKAGGTGLRDGDSKPPVLRALARGLGRAEDGDPATAAESRVVLPFGLTGALPSSETCFKNQDMPGC